MSSFSLPELLTPPKPTSAPQKARDIRDLDRALNQPIANMGRRGFGLDRKIHAMGYGKRLHHGDVLFFAKSFAR